MERTSIAKPPLITLASPTKTYYTGNLNRGISRSAGIIESSAGVICSPIVSDSMLESEIEEDPSSNKVGQYFFFVYIFLFISDIPYVFHTPSIY